MVPCMYIDMSETPRISERTYFFQRVSHLYFFFPHSLFLSFQEFLWPDILDHNQTPAVHSNEPNSAKLSSLPYVRLTSHTFCCLF